MIVQVVRIPWTGRIDVSKANATEARYLYASELVPIRPFRLQRWFSRERMDVKDAIKCSKFPGIYPLTTQDFVSHPPVTHTQ